MLNRLIKKIGRKLSPPPNFKKINGLEAFHQALPRIAFKKDLTSIRGWLSPLEQNALYGLGRLSPGPILEIGSWVGRSAICIASGVLDSTQKKEFVAAELGPTLENFRELEDGRIGFFYPVDSDTNMGACSKELYENEIEPVLEHPGGVLGQLRANLTAMEVDKAVTIVTGDFRDTLEPKTYQLIFIDAMHDEAEINRNAPCLKPLLAPGSILACHDTTPENQACLEGYFKFRYSFLADSLFIGEIAE